MPSLRIRELAATDTGFNAELTIETDRRTTYPIAIRNPFDPKTEQELEWYFEGWLACPDLDQVQAARAAASVETYGRDLFEQVFGDRKAYADYENLRRSLKLADGSVPIEIEGSPEFQALHWEALRDEDLPEPLAAIATMVRVNPQRRAGNPAVMSPSSVLNLLVITARPSGGQDVGYRTISRPLVKAIDDNELPVNVEFVRPGTWEALDRQLQERGAGYYHAIHFDLHGSVLTYDQARSLLDDESRTASNHTFKRGYGLQDIKPFNGAQGFLSFEADQIGTSILVSADEVATLLMDKGIPLCILNACQSAKQVRREAQGDKPAEETSLGARLLSAGMQAIVAMGYSVTVDAARVMMTALYRALFAGKPVMEAIRLGRRELLQNKERTSAWFGKKIDLEDWLLPVVYQGATVDLKLQPLSPGDKAMLMRDRARRYRFQEPTYGFIGRDTDILSIERRLLAPDENALLLQGMGGTGKTTLLRHLRDWWQRTGLIADSFYFGYDEKGYTLAQILFAIGQRVLSDEELREFQACDSETQQFWLTATLRSTRYALVLDNLESVTAAALSIPNALPEAEREAIAGWLRTLLGGKTLVLLGSRGREAWLSAVYGKNHLSLQGLDPAARLILAERILDKQVQDGRKIAAIQADGEFKKLMKLLAGYPLAMEVVLGNLARLSPGEVLAGLDAADMDLDRSDARDKTESILQCIDFSFCGLSESARELLVCLALFSGFIFVDGLKNFAMQLEQIPALVDRVGAHGNAPDDNAGATSGGRTAVTPLRERLGLAVQEAIAWGLLSPILQDNDRLLSIQPTLPFFLRSKLAGWDEAARSGLREAFKRHYRGLAQSYYQLIESKDSQEKQLGMQFCRWEYENISTALDFSLAQQEESFFETYGCLNSYLEKSGDKLKQLELAQTVYEALKDKLDNPQSEEFALKIMGVLGLVAAGFLQTQRYQESREAYFVTQSLVQGLTQFPENVKQQLIARTYHQLGIVAQELREYEEARRNYQQALQIKIEFNDRYSQASTYHQLGIVAQKLRDYEEARRNYQQALQIFIEF
ncbi:MAG: CHAT domain-containing protein, partial [Oscillatoriales cyanobacterium]